MATPPAHATMYIKAKEHINSYASVADLSYKKSYNTAVDLQKSINLLLKKPNTKNLLSAKKAWKKAHYYYGQTEALVFPLTLKTKERINGWPMDPSIIDAVHYDSTSGIINDNTLLVTAENLITKHMQFEEMDITLGFHAIEFLLWGEDLNNKQSSRKASDFTLKRRQDYLRVASNILVSDLKSVADEWSKNTGAYYHRFTSLPKDKAVIKIFNGLTHFSGLKFAGNYIGAPMISGNQADESSNFSDTTHLDYQSALQGMKNIWIGSYENFQGIAISDLVQKVNPDLANVILEQFIDAETKIATLPAPYDSEIFEKYPNHYLPIPNEQTHRKTLEKTMQSVLKLHVFFWQAMVEIGIYQWPTEKETLRYENNARMAN